MRRDAQDPRISLQTTAQFTRGAPWRLSLLHDLPDYLLIWTTKGQAVASLNGNRRGIGAHCAAIIPAGTLFSLDLGRTGGGLVLSLSPDLAAQTKLPDESRLMHLHGVQDQAEITGILDAIQREARSDQLHRMDACRAHIALLSVSLRRRMEEQGEPPKPTGAQRLVDAFCALVVKHYADGLTMADYARTLGVTPTHLTRSCKDRSGLTASDIIAQRSLYAARDLIETTSTPLQDISGQLGFGSPAYFSRFVQNHTGQSPSDLRRAARSRGLAAR
ncbi:MAG: AraC family transcriptional regulator [Thalassovita sp.]|nr:AraC family transcriptional regulator [Thalassovita sp.]